MKPADRAPTSRGRYTPPEICDVDLADDREFVVVAGSTPPSETPRN